MIHLCTCIVESYMYFVTINHIIASTPNNKATKSCVYIHDHILITLSSPYFALA